MRKAIFSSNDSNYIFGKTERANFSEDKNITFDSCNHYFSCNDLFFIDIKEV